MSPEILLILPQLVMMFAACFIFVAGRFVNNTRLWGPICLLVIPVAGICLFDVTNSPALMESTSSSSVLVDPLSLVMQWSCLGFGFLFVLTALRTQGDNKRSAEYFALLLLSLAGTMLAAAANDLIVLFVALELVCLPMHVLIWISRHEFTAREAATKHFLMSTLSSALILYGFSFVYGLCGSTNLVDVRVAFTAGNTPIEPHFASEYVPVLGIVALILIVAGLGYRLALVPFHFGLNEIFEGTTAGIAASLAVLPKLAAVVVLIRVAIGSMVGLEETGVLLAMVIAGVTMFVGSVMALRQDRVRQIFAYTTLAHGGFALAGLAVGFWDSAHPKQFLITIHSMPDGISSAILFLLSYAFSTVGLFAIFVYLAPSSRHMEYIDDLAGLSRSQPMAAFCFSVLLLNLIGMPPFIGFWGRVLVLSSTLSVGSEDVGSLDSGLNPGFVCLALIVILHVLMIATVYLRMLVKIWLDGQISRPLPSGGRGALIAALLSALLVVGSGISPGFFMVHIEDIQTKHAENHVQQRSDTGSKKVEGRANLSPKTKTPTITTPVHAERGHAERVHAERGHPAY